MDPAEERPSSNSLAEELLELIEKKRAENKLLSKLSGLLTFPEPGPAGPLDPRAENEAKEDHQQAVSTKKPKQ